MNNSQNQTMASYLPNRRCFFQAYVNYLGLLTEGKRHDSAMLRMSGLLHQLEQYSFNQTGHPLCIYGDPGYPLHTSPF